MGGFGGGFGGGGGFGFPPLGGAAALPPPPVPPPQADNEWDIAFSEIAQMFHELGVSLHGQPLHPPNMIFWNVRADPLGYAAAADQKGVMMLFGYSPALMKFILSGEMEEKTLTLDHHRKMARSSRLVSRWIRAKPCSASLMTLVSRLCAPLSMLTPPKP